MLRLMTETATTPDARPWRKRHPVVSRVLLYSLGLGLAVLLFVLFTNRKQDDERTRIAALQVELDGLGIVLATDPTGNAVLAKLDEKFSDAGLPVITQGRVLRWRAMAWRRKAAMAADAAARTSAVAKVEAAFLEALELDLEPLERIALHLEWAEARLERRDVEGARAVLPPLNVMAGLLPQTLLRALLVAQALRLEEDVEASVKLARATLVGLEASLADGSEAYVGGRTWTAGQVAVELANFATTVGDPAEVRTAWNRFRAAAPGDFDVQVAAARGLLRGGAEDDARAAWRAARRINGDLAASEARRDEALQALERERVDR